jgi:hypothetical protein
MNHRLPPHCETTLTAAWKGWTWNDVTSSRCSPALSVLPLRPHAGCQRHLTRDTSIPPVSPANSLQGRQLLVDHAGGIETFGAACRTESAAATARRVRSMSAPSRYGPLR